MPLVRITQQDVRTPEQSRQLADIAQEVMLELLNAPPADRHHIVETLPLDSIIAQHTGRGLSAATEW